ncbi:MAG: hypothetical protein ACTSSM_13470 [Promethearchaeota archaeon]
MKTKRIVAFGVLMLFIVTPFFGLVSFAKAQMVPLIRPQNRGIQQPLKLI